jgi:hypothetical protein
VFETNCSAVFQGNLSPAHWLSLAAFQLLDNSLEFFLRILDQLIAHSAFPELNQGSRRLPDDRAM